jgi:hypothetical protein
MQALAPLHKHTVVLQGGFFRQCQLYWLLILCHKESSLDLGSSLKGNGVDPLVSFSNAEFNLADAIFFIRILVHCIDSLYCNQANKNVAGCTIINRGILSYCR